MKSDKVASDQYIKSRDRQIEMGKKCNVGDGE